MIQPTKDACGLWKFDTLPEGALLVTMDMFTQGAMSKTNTPYVIYSKLYKEYQCFRVNANTHNKIIPFLQLNRVYLLPTTSHIPKSKEGINLTNTELELKL